MLNYQFFENTSESIVEEWFTAPYEDGLVVKGCRCSGDVGNICIPEAIDDKPVLAVINNGGWLGMPNFPSGSNILIPSSVRRIYGKSHDLSWIERTCIHPENPHFAVKNGLLLSDDLQKVHLLCDRSLTEIVIPDEVTQILDGAFYDETELRAIHLGAGVQTIAADAFPNTKAGNIRIHGRHTGDYRKLALERITVSEENPNFASRDGFLYTKDLSVLVKAPEIIPGGAFAVPAEVKAIASQAFIQNQGIRMLVAPHHLESIGEKAFYDCFGLETVRLARVDIVDKEAFHECDGISELHLGMVQELRLWSFADCKKLADLTMCSATAIGHSAFRGCRKLEKLILPPDLKKIENGAFEYCGLKYIAIPRSVENVEGSPFIYCEGLDIELYDTTQVNPGKIAYCGVYECAKHWITVKSAADDKILYRVYMGRENGTSSGYREAVVNAWSNYPEFDFDALDKAFSTLREADEKLEVARLRLTYPVALSDETRKQYMDYLRRGAKKTLARSVQENDLETVRFLVGLGILKRDAVDEAIGLCDGAKNPEIMALLLSQQENAPGKAKDPLKMPTDTAALKKFWSTQKLPDGTLELTSYKGDEEEVFVPNQIGKAVVTRLGDNVMNMVEANKAKAEKLKKVKKVIISEGITGIGTNAFLGCRNITEITLPDSLREIGNYAFSSCSGLKDMKLPQGLTRLGNGCFGHCTNLFAVNIPETVTEIGGSAFDGCKDLTGITVPEQVASIGESAFSGCPGLQDEQGFVIIRDVLYNYYGTTQNLVVPQHIRTIGSYSFRQNASVQTVTLPEGLTEIGFGAFGECATLREIHIPATVKMLEPMLFEKCARLARVSLHDGIERMEHGVFKGCKALKEITLPALLTVISGELLASCASLETVIIPESVTAIGYDAFLHCKALREIHIPAAVTKIGYNSFRNCPNLKIFAPAGSYAETYAKENNIPFVAE